MDKKSRLYDHNGVPIGGNPSGVDNLSISAQALIEARINNAINDIREHNRDDLQDLARDHVKKWRFIALLSIAFGIVSSLVTIITTFYAPDEIREWIMEQVDNKLTLPMLKESADRVMQDKMSAYVDERMQPLKVQASSLETSLESIKKDVDGKQDALEREQQDLANQLNVSKFAVAAKAGSRSSYERLLELQNIPKQPKDLINASLKEIELYFDADRNQVSYSILVDGSTLKDPGYAVDELIYNLHVLPPELTEATVNSLSALNSTKCVQELCNLIKDTGNLRVAARATRALEKITGERIKPLEFDKVAKWWSDNSSIAKYNGSYDSYLEVYPSGLSLLMGKDKLEMLIGQLQATIDSDPDALHSQCLQAGLLLMLDNDEQARIVLDKVRARRNDYRWLNVWDAAFYAKANNTEEAVKLINMAFAKSPTKDVEATVRRWKLFQPILNNDQINWPSKKAPAKQ